MDKDAKQELLAELTPDIAATALVELEKLEKRRVQVSSPLDLLKELFKGMRDPQPAENNFTPIQSLPETPAEFPKLLVSYGKTTEWTIVENWNEWAPLHHWWVRPMSELPTLKEQGARERPKEEHERRRKGAA